MARRKTTLREHHRRWGLYIAVIVFIAAAAAFVIGFAREGEVAREPWGYVAVAVAILAAVGGLLLSFAQAAYEAQDND